jgi:hypothetical protein
MSEPHSSPATDTEYYVEVQSQDEQIKRYLTMDAVRDDLLAAVITRHTMARQCCPKPEKAAYQDSDDEFRTAIQAWKKSNIWRPIGEGLAKEVNTIRTLYEPQVVAVKSGGEIGSGICFVPLFIWFLIVAIIAGCSWDPSQASPNQPFTPGAPGAGATLKVLESMPVVSNIIALILYSILAFLGAGLLGLAIGYPIGATVGFLISWARKDTYPKPPPDGYLEDYRKCKQSPISIQAIEGSPA